MTEVSQKLKDMANELLICLRDMGYFNQKDLKEITTLIDKKFKKQRDDEYETIFN